MRSTPQHICDEIVALGRGGLSANKIVAQMHIAKGTVSRVLTEAGIGPKPTEFWTAEDDGLIEELWQSGVVTIEIGKRVGKTKNAVIARAKRLGLERRPNPITVKRPKKVTRTFEQYKAERAEKARLAAEERARVAAEKKAARPAKAPKVKVSKAKAVTPKPAEPPKPAAPVYTQTEAHRIANAAFGPDGYHDNACAWPVGRPGRSGFRYCNAPREGDRNYCEAHRAIAYQKRGEAQVSPASEYRPGHPEMRAG